MLTVLDPASNDYAQRDNIAGMVFLQMVVDAQWTSGRSDHRAARSASAWTRRAVEAVEHAQFRAGTLNGKPVPELVNLQVTFRIYSNRTKPTGAPSIPTQVAPTIAKKPPSNAPVLASAEAQPQDEYTIRSGTFFTIVPDSPRH